MVPATALIPIPEKLTPRSGSFALGATTSIAAGADLRVAAELLRDQLRPATGLPMAIASSAARSRIALSLDPTLGSLGDDLSGADSLDHPGVAPIDLDGEGSTGLQWHVDQLCHPTPRPTLKPRP